MIERLKQLTDSARGQNIKVLLKRATANEKRLDIAYVLLSEPMQKPMEQTVCLQPVLEDGQRNSRGYPMQCLIMVMKA